MGLKCTDSIVKHRWVLSSALQVTSYVALTQGSYTNVFYFLSCKGVW